MASKTETNQTKKCVGVAFSDFDEGLTAARWAKEEFANNEPLRKEYGPLCVIFIKRGVGDPRDITDTIAKDRQIDTWGIIEEYIFKDADNVRTQAFQDSTERFEKNIFVKIYHGASIQQTLQFAIKELQRLHGLGMLIVGCAAGAANTTQESSQTILPIHLDLPAGCSIVLVAKTDEKEEEKKGKEKEDEKEKGKLWKITCMVVSTGTKVPLRADLFHYYQLK
ncbi:hypothetical protein BS78_08G006300 [Paspalum vaginatum]|nr:hypothetical protein BS78_08G006300 [Paspalum vaginatum]